jgi:hypothetical protein
MYMFVTIDWVPVPVNDGTKLKTIDSRITYAWERCAIRYMPRLAGDPAKNEFAPTLVHKTNENHTTGCLPSVQGPSNA